MAGQKSIDTKLSPVDMEKIEVIESGEIATDIEGKMLENLDYSGAHEKTDPAEIKLVKKLDLWIMPTLWLMYWLNYLDRNAIALARLNDLEEDLNLTSTRKLTVPWYLAGSHF